MNMQISFFILSSLLSVPLWAGTSGPARSGLEHFSQDLETLKASFTQTVKGQDGRLESEGSGDVWLKRPGLFRWSYGGEFPELIVADGQRVWLYDPTLEQVTVKPQSGMAENSPLMLLTDLDAIDEQFIVREAGDYEGIDLLELESRNPESEFDRVMLGFRDQSLVLMSLEDAFGLRTEIWFSDMRRNPELDNALFHFEPPENTDVVGESSDDSPE
jgi:outer membrane lipoprotein carrier protein